MSMVTDFISVKENEFEGCAILLFINWRSRKVCCCHDNSDWFLAYIQTRALLPILYENNKHSKPIYVILNVLTARIENKAKKD